MKRFFVLAVILCLFAQFSFSETFGLKPAKSGNLGLGFCLGEPSGISLKYFLNKENAIDGVIAWDFSSQSFAFSADYLFHFNNLLIIENHYIPLHAGVGGFLSLSSKIDTTLVLGVKFPFGVSYFIPRTAFEVYLEFAPGIDLYPATLFDPAGGLGLRYYF